MTIFTRIDAIAIGCILALYKERIISILRPYLKILFFLSVFSLMILGHIHINYLENYYLLMICNALLTSHGTIANFCTGIIILYSINNTKGIWFKFLNTKLLNFIGILSYSLYLWQQIFLIGSNSTFRDFPQNLIFLFAMALFSYYVIEKPFLKLKHKFSRK